jgi:hypothetical protein
VVGCPNKTIAPTGGIIVFIWAIPFQNEKELCLHLILKNKSLVNFKVTNAKTMHDLHIWSLILTVCLLVNFVRDIVVTPFMVGLQKIFSGD